VLGTWLTKRRGLAAVLELPERQAGEIVQPASVSLVSIGQVARLAPGVAAGVSTACAGMRQAGNGFLFERDASYNHFKVNSRPVWAARVKGVISALLDWMGPTARRQSVGAGIHRAGSFKYHHRPE